MEGLLPLPRVSTTPRPLSIPVAGVDGGPQREGHTSLRDNAAHYRLHILPCVGVKHIAEWTRDDMRRLLRYLDAKIVAGEISWKTTRNVVRNGFGAPFPGSWHARTTEGIRRCGQPPTIAQPAICGLAF